MLADQPPGAKMGLAGRVRSITVPLSWYPRLHGATAAQRASWQLLGDGEGIHWPDADEDLSVAGLLAGRVRPGSSAR